MNKHTNANSILQNEVRPASIAAAAVLATIMFFTPTGYAQEPLCLGDNDLALINGNIHTLDENNTIVSSVLIRNGEFLDLAGTNYQNRSCTDIVDLDGRTVIPGLIDNHVHFVRIQNRENHVQELP